MTDQSSDPKSSSVLHRWSERKTRVRQAQQLADREPQQLSVRQPSLPEQTRQAPPDADTPPAGPVQELSDVELPDLDTIDEKTDMSIFFSEKVSAELRRLALRKLFHLPAYNIRDGLNDYDEDYTTFAKLGETVTAEMRYRQRVAERLEKEKQERQEQQQQQQQQLAETRDTPDQPHTEHRDAPDSAAGQSAAPQTDTPEQDPVAAGNEQRTDDESERT